MSPQKKNWDRAVEYWATLKSDPDAKFDKEVEIKGDDISPMVTWGTSPQDVVSVTGVVPDPEKEKDEERKKSMMRSLNYMGLKPNTKIIDIKVDQIFIGSPDVIGQIPTIKKTAKKNKPKFLFELIFILFMNFIIFIFS